eukprot:gene9934-2116_t
MELVWQETLDVTKDAPLAIQSLCLQRGLGNQVIFNRDSCSTTALNYNEHDVNGASCLHWVVWLSNVEIFKKLTVSYPNLAASTTNVGQTPIMWVCSRDQTHQRQCLGETAFTLQFLRQLCTIHPEGIHQVDKFGLSPLLLAVQSRNKLAVLFLIYKGIDIDLSDSNGASAIAWAAFIGDLDFLFLFQGLGMNVNTFDRLGMTPLHRAAQSGNAQFIRTLIDWPRNRSCVQLHALNIYGQRALDIAQDFGFSESADILKRAEKVASFYNARAYPHRFPAFYKSSVLLCAGLWMFYLAPVTWTSLTPYYHGIAGLLLILWIINWRNIVTIDAGTVSTIAAREQLAHEILHGSSLIAADDICFTCRIRKPLRSKHDAMTNKCYHRFDHFCSWLCVPIAADNYREFVLHIFIQFIGHVMFAHMCYTAVHHESALQTTLLTAAFFAALAVNLFGLAFAGLLVRTHATLISSNLTTNEAINKHKYQYLNKLDRNGNTRFRNPFNKGLWHNICDMLGKPSQRHIYQFDGTYKYVYEPPSSVIAS